MLYFNRKHLKSSKISIYIIFNAQSKRVHNKNREFAAQIDIMRFWAKLFGEMKTSLNDDN